MREILDLEYVISVLDTLYEQGDTCTHPVTGAVVTDSEYDAMRARLAHLKPNSHVLKTVTASQVTSFVKKVTHRPPMTSIHKAIGTLAERQQELERWKRDVIKELGYKGPIEEWACQAYKLDGVACALYYEKGKLIVAGLRPRDGVSGEDITENIKHVEGVKTQLLVPITGTIRGEIICKKSVFAKINAELAKKGEKTFANPRNYAAGSIRQFKDPQITKERKLSFVAYAIISDDIKEKDEVKLAKWCNKELGITYVRTSPFGHKDKDDKVWDFKALEDNVPNLDYEVDGTVISVRNTDDREQMGHHGGDQTKSPKGRLAWKFEEEHVDVTVKDCLWETGRTGAIVPVLQFSGVQLAGTNVTQCTGHNLGFLIRNKIGAGTVVRIIKSGQIIPKVVSVISNHSQPNTPKHCQACGQLATIVPGDDPTMLELMCLNVSCNARIVNTITHYLSTLGVKGVAESTVQKLYDAGLVKNPADLYKLNSDQLQKIGLGDRNSRLAIARIHMLDQAEKLDDTDLDKSLVQIVVNKKKVQLWQFFAALGIEGAGRTAGRALANQFGSFANIQNASVDDLCKTDGIGHKTAQVIHDFFSFNIGLVNDLLTHIELELPKTGKLTGKTFVFTGSFPEGKSFWEKQVEDQGGKVASSVSKKVDYVVVGTDAGSKEKKADDLGISKLNISDLKKLC